MIDAFIGAICIVSLLLNVVLVYDAVMTRRAGERFQQFMKQKEHDRDRVARALVYRFEYLAKAHREDHDKLEPMAKAVSKQGQAARIMRGGFDGLASAYGDAAEGIQRFIVWEQDPSELLEEAKEADQC